MSNAKLAAELEALAGKALTYSPAPHVATAGTSYALPSGEYGEPAIYDATGDYVVIGAPEAIGRLWVALVNNLPAILSALRAEPDEAAVERVKTAVEEGLHYGLPQVDASLVPADLAESIARAAIAAMKGGERG